MFVVQRVVNGHSYYNTARALDTHSTSLGPILQKISCVLRSSAKLGLAPKGVPQLLAIQYTIF